MTPDERYAKIDARLEAIAMHLELTASMAHARKARTDKTDKRIDGVLAAAQKDGVNICALARIAEIRSIA